MCHTKPMETRDGVSTLEQRSPSLSIFMVSILEWLSSLDSGNVSSWNAVVLTCYIEVPFVSFYQCHLPILMTTADFAFQTETDGTHVQRTYQN